MKTNVKIGLCVTGTLLILGVLLALFGKVGWSLLALIACLCVLIPTLKANRESEGDAFRYMTKEEKDMAAGARKRIAAQKAKFAPKPVVTTQERLAQKLQVGKKKP